MIIHMLFPGFIVDLKGFYTRGKGVCKNLCSWKFLLFLEFASFLNSGCTGS